jgi:hypothetical protein
MIQHPRMVKILEILLIQNILEMTHWRLPGLLAAGALHRLNIMWVYDIC